MESRNSVVKIKEKFEKLNSSVHSVNHRSQVLSCETLVPLNRNGAVKQSNNNKCFIKRSHAFRCDKTPLKPFSNSSAVSASVSNDNECSPSTVPPQLPNRPLPFPRPAPRSVLIETKNKCVNIEVTPKVGYSTDTLKAVLKAPLPPGPAPRKPPRTFLQTHGNRNRDAERISKGRSGSLTHNTILERPLQYALPARSKTESQIKLKKLEAACLSNTPSNVPIKKTSDKTPSPLSTNPFVINDKRESGLNFQLAPCPKVENTIKRNSLDSSFWLEALNCINSSFGNYSLSSSPHQCDCSIIPAGQKSGSVWMSQPCEHIYSQPYSPRSPRKASSSSLPDRNSKGVMKDSPRSLHYMSCPIRTCPDPAVNREWNSKSSKKTHIVNELKENNNDVPDNIVKDEPCPNCASSSEKPNCSLYDAILLIGLDFLSSETKKPIIKFKHPPDAQIEAGLVALSFPDADYWPPSVTYSHNNYTQILTDDKGLRKYAYCHRLQPEETSIVPLVYVIVTHHNSNVLYYGILSQLEEKHGESETSVKNFIDSLAKRKFPHCLESLKHYKDSPFEEESSKEPSLLKFDDNPLPRILETVPLTHFLLLLGCVLNERKIILLSDNVSRLSDGVHSLLHNIRPFSWLHTVVTVTPANLTDVMIDCPTPCIIGVLKDSFKRTSFNTLENGRMIFDLDTGTTVQNVGDEFQLLPQNQSKKLSASLKNVFAKKEATYSVAFRNFFFKIMEGHRSFVLPNGQIQKSEFIKYAKTDELKTFLRRFVDTAMFHHFVKNIEQSTS